MISDPVPAEPAGERARCVQVDVEESDCDLVSGLLWAAGATALQQIDLGPGRHRLVAGIPRSAEPALSARLGPRWAPDFLDAEFEGWLDAWRPFARPVRAGRVLVHPPWVPVTTRAGEVVVSIDPGRAFGQGAHVTTRLVLTVAERVVAGGESVLDVGCGSGVLSVVAAALGARRVTAVDIEDEAVRATNENADRNGLATRIRATSRPIDEVAGPFDLVLANILAPVLVELAPHLIARVRVGGRVVLGGLRAEQQARVVSAYGELALEDEGGDGSWRVLVLRREPRAR
jgi:ribosomal protein L11 methyltransferase